MKNFLYKKKRSILEILIKITQYLKFNALLYCLKILILKLVIKVKLLKITHLKKIISTIKTKAILKRNQIKRFQIKIFRKSCC